MSRPLRILYPGAWYHVMNRGLRGQSIFEDDEDRAVFLDLVMEAREVYGINVAAYCLMTNHYHLLVQTPDPNLPRVMRHINGVYTQRYNRRHGLDGPLFRGRYRAVLVDPQGFLPEVVRYIHLNPIRAGLEAALGQYAWSSHNAYLSKARRWSWLSKDLVLRLLHWDAGQQRKAYCEFMEREVPVHVSRFYGLKNLRSVLGSSAFVQSIKDAFIDAVDHKEVPEASWMKATVPEVLELVSAEFGLPPEALLCSRRGTSSPARDVAIYLAYLHTKETQTSLAEQFELARHSSMGTAVRRVETAMRENQEMLRLVRRLEGRLREGGA